MLFLGGGWEVITIQRRCYSELFGSENGNGSGYSCTYRRKKERMKYDMIVL